MKLRTALATVAWIAEAIARSAVDEVRWWRDARACRREYIGGLTNEEIDRRMRTRE